jgi:hypothetical protein
MRAARSAAVLRQAAARLYSRNRPPSLVVTTTGWPTACGRSSYFACWPTTCAGTWSAGGPRCCIATSSRLF